MANLKGISNSVTPVAQKQKKEMSGANIPEYIWTEAKKELRPVKGRFRIYEQGREGGSETVTFRKYHPAICEMFRKEMADGEIYEIPLYAARFINGFDSHAKHLNGNIHSCSHAKHGFKMSSPNQLHPSSETGSNEQGGGIPIPISGINQYVKRIGFESLEFGTEIE